jgi:DNA mismatch endonuclease (patch repair protein)
VADVVSKEVRSKMMSAIKGRDTKPELLIRKGLHALGVRYSLHRRDLPGKPDLVLTKHNAIIFIHGCFWHRHNCYLFKWPSTRIAFWKKKLNRNVEVDERNIDLLLSKGWRIGVVWECALKGKSEDKITKVVNQCHNWLLSKNFYLEIKDLA